MPPAKKKKLMWHATVAKLGLGLAFSVCSFQSLPLNQADARMPTCLGLLASFRVASLLRNAIARMPTCLGLLAISTPECYRCLCEKESVSAKGRDVENKKQGKQN
jgi:hypothetical protein